MKKKKIGNTVKSIKKKEYGYPDLERNFMNFWIYGISSL